MDCPECGEPGECVDTNVSLDPEVVEKIYVCTGFCGVVFSSEGWWEHV
jgi:hypothetical protein